MTVPSPVLRLVTVATVKALARVNMTVVFKHRLSVLTRATTRVPTLVPPVAGDTQQSTRF